MRQLEATELPAALPRPGAPARWDDQNRRKAEWTWVAV